MGFWNLFGRKVEVSAKEEMSKESSSDDGEDAKNEEVPPSGNEGIKMINYGTGMPIDVIYSYLKEDYEQRGYDDAICSPDISYKEKNLSIIQSNLEVRFKQVLLNYEDELRNVDFHIESRTQAGLIDIVKQLASRRNMLLQHVKELHKMEEDFRQKSTYMTGMLLSYERGFLRGLAAISLNSIKEKAE